MRRLTMGAAAIFVAALMLPASPADAKVQCDPTALQNAVAAANAAGSGVLRLKPGCDYSITTPSIATTALPPVTGNIKIEGAKGAVISRSATAPTDFRLFTVAAGGTLRLDHLTLTNGRTGGLGGAVEVQGSGALTAVHVAFLENLAANGGAVAILGGATGVIKDSRFARNQTTGVGGGAAINIGTLKVKRSTLVGNTAPLNGGAINTQTTGVTTLFKSTVERNTSVSLGGGLSNLGTTFVKRSKIVRNTGSSGGGIATGNSNVFISKGSEVKRNRPDNCVPQNTIPRCKN